MREIKFRAFDVSENMTYFQLDGQALKRGVREQPLRSMLQQEEGFELMQYTGLKDAHANDIYEGDIVLYKKLISVVEWMWYMWIFKHKDMGDMAQDHVVASSHSSVKIIGNIYENPDLL